MQVSLNPLLNVFVKGAKLGPYTIQLKDKIGRASCRERVCQYV